MANYWSETWTGTSGSAWPPGWENAGDGSVSIQSGRGRLRSGAGEYYDHRARLARMADTRDVNVLLTFTFGVAGERYLSVGVRTPSNDPLGDNKSVAQRGMYVQVYDFFGPGIWLVRIGHFGYYTNLVNVTAGMPALTPGVDYKLRFRADGKRFRARVWAASSSEPATWLIDHTDADAYLEPGKVTVGYSTSATGTDGYIDFDDLNVASLDPVLPGPPEPPTRHEWAMWSRAGDYSPDQPLPIASVKLLERHLGVSKAIVETQYTLERWQSLQPSRGLLLYRDGEQEFTGMVSAREQRWDAKSGELRILIEAVSEEQHLADRLAMPDPSRAADIQNTLDYWTFTGVASSAMWQLISDQAGPTCNPTRRVPGLAMGANPGIGLSRTWTSLFNSAGDDGVLDQLAAISVASGENLGVRMTSAAGTVTADIVKPRDLAGSIRFSAELRNLVGYTYREQAPTCTDGLAAGQGDLHLRLRKHVTTASTLALAWGRQVWKYLDRRDTADVAELTKAATDAVTEGDAKVSLAVTLTDSQAATYGRDWGLGDRITIYVAPPGQATSIAVSDVVREILIEVDDNGAESITPAVGTWDATALPPSPTQEQLSLVGSAVAGLVSRK